MRDAKQLKIELSFFRLIPTTKKQQHILFGNSRPAKDIDSSERFELQQSPYD